MKKGDCMQPIFANYTASITELKKSPTKLLEDAKDEAIAILNHNVTSAYLVPAKIYEEMMDMLDDYELARIAEERMNDKEVPIRVDVDDLLS
jgi:antitoxin StbD